MTLSSTKLALYDSLKLMKSTSRMISSPTKSVPDWDATSCTDSSSSSSDVDFVVGKHTNNAKAGKKRVSFSTVHIYSHAIVLGDHPCVSAGPPMALGDEVLEEDHLEMDLYEQCRPHHRRHMSMIVVPPAEREARLLRTGYDPSQLATATHEIQRIQKQRRKNAQVSRVEQQRLWQRRTAARR